MNSYLYVKSAELSWEYSEKTAFEHVRDSSAVGDEKLNFAPLDRKPYSIRQLAMMAIYVLGPKRLTTVKNNWARSRNSSKQVLLTDEIIERLVCQQCNGGPLLRRDDVITCSSCGANYHQRQGIFDFDMSPSEPTLAHQTIGR